ncbi:MAG TPA: peptide deformylase [Alphaproteobacteria bacterium]|nr:peptide deformylase [Alphaproteobacteria bacterium]
MSLLKVVRLGDPVLRRVAEPIADPTDPVIRQLAESMIETMFVAPGVGLAAPQVGESIRMIVMRIMADRSAGADQPERQQVVALINPEVEPLGAETELGWEGCLSAPPLRGLVPRSSRVRFKGLLLDGQQIAGEASGFQARILQHEVDHLDGIVYLDRMTDLSSLGYDDELQAAAQAAADAAATAADNL